MFRSTLFAAAASAILFASAGAASAEDFVSNGRTSPVYHGDLDLSNPAHRHSARSSRPSQSRR